MNGHLHPVGQPLRWGRLESRREIEAYVADRRQVLAELCRQEGLGEFRQAGQEQLEFEVAA